MLRAQRLLSTLAGGLLLSAASQAACSSTPLVQEADPAAIQAFVQGRGQQVLSFVGYSGAGYEDEAAMLALAGRALDAHDPARVLVNIGATAEGIGAVYALARQRGFTTLGIVSTLAREHQVPLSPCVDRVFFVPDRSWGGQDATTGQLSPTSQAMVAVSHHLVGIGGGEVARDELLAAQRLGKPVQFHPADMHHGTALDKARRKGDPAPSDFRGAAHLALLPG
ncbi:MAG: hypothetical protein V4795_09475 [Pseudomonadota bacterium]